jgi:kumamolisin
MKKNRKLLEGSKPTIMDSARFVGKPEGSKRIEVSMILRFKPSIVNLAGHAKSLDKYPHKHMSHDEYESNFGTSPDDIELIKKFAAEHRLDVMDIDAASRCVTLEGTVEAFSKAFDVCLEEYEHPDHPRSFHTHKEHLSIPEELHGIVTAVFGLNNQPMLSPHVGTVEQTGTEGGDHQSAIEPFKPTQLAEYYNFPKDLTGKGQSIAILAIGGGYKVEDLRYYFENIINVPMPNITVEYGENSPGAGSWMRDAEICVDIEIIGAIAFEADIHVYFAENNAHSISSAIRKMINDNNSVISISFGSAESKLEKAWGRPSLSEMNNLFTRASLHGITVCIASGDYGSFGQIEDGKPHVYFPASCQYVLACGGTQFTFQDNKIYSEVTWNETGKYKQMNFTAASGGGASQLFSRPQYQENADIVLIASNAKNSGVKENGKKGRYLPDVAYYASMSPGYYTYRDNQDDLGGGTSAATPLYAALVALINEKLEAMGKQPAGCINSYLYETGNAGEEELFNDITKGKNDISDLGLYSAAPGWDACTGWGSVNGSKLLEGLLKAHS